MNILFLDIDGVLNTKSYLTDNFMGRLDDPRQAIDPRAVERVNQIVAQTGAVVVLCTAWRREFSKREIASYLGDRGFKGTIVSQTPIYKDQLRGREVLGWLGSTVLPVDSFVILDDLDEFDLRGLRGRHVRTDAEVGLEDHHVDEAVRILDQPVRRGALRLLAS